MRLLLFCLCALFLPIFGKVKVSEDHQLFKKPLNVSISSSKDDLIVCYSLGQTPVPRWRVNCGVKFLIISTTTMLKLQEFDAKGVAAGEMLVVTYINIPDTITNITAGRTLSTYYKNNLEASLKSLPTISFVIPTANWQGLAKDDAIPVSMEMWGKGSPDFQIICGAKYFGGASINYDKKSVRTYHSKKYGGPSKLEADLFEGFEEGTYVTDEFDQVYIRSGSQDSFTVRDLRYPTNVRNIWMDGMFREIGQPAPHGRFSHMYLNGTYRGIFHIRERFDASFMADYFGGEKEDYEAVNSGVAFDGTGSVWQLILQHKSNYTFIEPYIDIRNFIDYHMLNWYAGNVDWPHHNWIGVGPTQPNRGGYKFFNSDSDTIFGNRANNQNIALTQTQLGNGIGGVYNQLWLARHVDFVQAVYDSVFELFFRKECVLQYPNTEKKYMKYVDMIDLGMIAETVRWGLPTYGRNETWRPYIQDFLQKVYFPNRSAAFANLLVQREMIAPLAPPTFSVRSQTVTAGFQLTIRNPQTSGTVYYTLDGSDPRLPGGKINPAAKTAKSPLTQAIYTTTDIRARVRVSETNWSPLDFVTLRSQVSCTGVTTEKDCPVRDTILITEIMHEPEDGKGSLEFIEIKNVGKFTYNFHKASFTKGIVYDFPGSAVLAPGEFYVIARNPSRFYNRYGFYPDGKFQGKLSSGEKVTIKDALDRTIVSVDYDSEKPWPTLTQSGGFSLVPIDPNHNPDSDNASYWRPCSSIGGSPGKDDPEPSGPTLLINEVGANASYIEIVNPTTVTVNLNGWSLSDKQSEPLRFVFGSSWGSLAPGKYALVSAKDHKLDINVEGETIYLFPPGQPQSDSFHVGPNDPVLSYGRFKLATGEVRIRLLSSPTPATSNDPVLVGPLVITEIHASGSPQFIRVFSRDGPIDLGQFQLEGDVQFRFPSITATECYLTDIADVNRLLDVYGLNGSYTECLLGPWTGGLRSDLGSLRLIQVPYQRLIDEVNYEASWGQMSATKMMARLWTKNYGDESANWKLVGVPIPPEPLQPEPEIQPEPDYENPVSPSDPTTGGSSNTTGSSNEPDGGGLSGGAIVGIVIGSAVAAALVIAGIAFVVASQMTASASAGTDYTRF